MATLVNKKGGELMINVKTMERFLRPLDREEKAVWILRREDMKESDKIEELTNLGYNLDEIVGLALGM